MSHEDRVFLRKRNLQWMLTQLAPGDRLPPIVRLTLKGACTRTEQVQVAFDSFDGGENWTCDHLTLRALDNRGLARWVCTCAPEQTAAGYLCLHAAAAAKLYLSELDSPEFGTPGYGVQTY